MYRLAAVLIMVSVNLPLPASATMQVRDSLEFGGRRYVIYQQPMLGYWYDKDWNSSGTKPFPKFEVVSSNNWRGYEAAWYIRDGQLWLRKIAGRIGGRRVKNEDVILDYAFPAQAEWFTGRIFLAVGDYNQDLGEYAAVLVLHIAHGKLKKITFRESSRLVSSWNGMKPPIEAPKPTAVAAVQVKEIEGFYRFDDASLSVDQRRAVRAAATEIYPGKTKRYLDRHCRFDRPEPDNEGWSINVWDVSIREDGTLAMRPGGFTTVLLDRDFEVVRLIGGL